MLEHQLGAVGQRGIVGLLGGELGLGERQQKLGAVGSTLVDTGLELVDPRDEAAKIHLLTGRFIEVDGVEGIARLGQLALEIIDLDGLGLGHRLGHLHADGELVEAPAEIDDQHVVGDDRQGSRHRAATGREHEGQGQDDGGHRSHINLQVGSSAPGVTSARPVGSTTARPLPPRKSGAGSAPWWPPTGECRHPGALQSTSTPSRSAASVRSSPAVAATTTATRSGEAPRAFRRRSSWSARASS